MNRPDDQLHVTVEQHNGQAEGDDGHPYYVASCTQLGLVTDGLTLNELFANLREAIALALRGEDMIATYNVVPTPRVIITMELPANNPFALRPAFPAV